ncbi:MAG: FtsX-like permease family protein [Bacteroides sp.]|nr:FtsX-like permease family protein [Roseburia sp.]MCM1347413.1 FtsX-like permease family protein [Bacteroides sp.]MCM1420594.1 FtsX-like permease family protein [Bacteroides sp.]
MKTLFRNIKYMFRRFFAANILNLLGMALSLTAFVVIMKQVNYDYSYDKGIKNYDRIFKALEYEGSNIKEAESNMFRPLGELIAESSPQIEAAAIMSATATPIDAHIGENIFSLQLMYGFGDYMKVFQPEMICGSTDAIDTETPNKVLISESTAKMLFGTVDVVDTVLHVSDQYSEGDMYVGGVYKDFPENSTIKNFVFTIFWPRLNKNNWQNANYNVYVRLNDKYAARNVEEAIAKKLEALPEEKFREIPIHLAPLTDLHFLSGESSRFMVYLLMCASFLLVIIAAVNYTNFALAETPMRLRSINTQRVLGATTTKLRAILVGESIVISLIAFVLSVGILFVLPKLGVQELVAADISPLHHPGTIGWAFLLCIAIGVVAGIYPAWYATSFPPALVLKGSYGLSPQGKLLRTTLISVQFISAFTLVVCIGVIFLQSKFIRNSDYGYDKELVLAGNMTQETRHQKEAVRNELMKINGVEGVSFSQFILSSSDSYMGWGRGDEEHHMSFIAMPVDYHYLSVMGIKVVKGRDFREYDSDVYIFNEAALIEYPWLELDKPALTDDLPVVGFCENVKVSSFRIDNNTTPLAFIIFGNKYQGWAADECFNVRVSANVDKIETAKTLQRTLEAFSPGHDFNIQFIDRILDETYKSEMRFQKQIMLFSILAIVICFIGVFGLTMFESEYRKKEIGLRKIMGSSTKSILWMFCSRYIKILVGCFIVGAPLGWKFSDEWLKTFAERTPIYWWIFPIAFMAVAGFTLLIVIYQTWKNANMNPVESIKTE